MVLGPGEYGGELEPLVETIATVSGWEGCGVVAVPHGRREHVVRDVPSGGRPVTLVWRKRIWRCEEPRCDRRTWSERSEAIRPKAALTERARMWATRRIGEDADTVEDLRLQLGVSWGTVMRAVREYGAPRVDDPDRLAGVAGLGVDETDWPRATTARSPQYVTGIVDLSPGRPARLLDVVPGRSGRAYASWIGDREDSWRAGIGFAALDPFRGYATALRTELPHAVRVLDAFHVVRLGFQAVDEVRRRVQQQTLGHRGRTGDPLYGIRRELRRGADKLSERSSRSPRRARCGSPPTPARSPPRRSSTSANDCCTIPTGQSSSSSTATPPTAPAPCRSSSRPPTGGCGCSCCPATPRNSTPTNGSGRTSRPTASAAPASPDPTDRKSTRLNSSH